MNEFFLYEQLCTLEQIGKRYMAGEEFGRKTRAIADRIVSQIYRVAVVGEFKRGKSSLINALLGASLLPTDILPATAAINRVAYGEKERIVVRYRDGRSEERTVDELLEFGTKLDAHKEELARTVREIEVYYPSVFCKNHIEVLDTPGLNDNEEMTRLTLSILGEVDAAIFVVSAREPLSMTEQDLILTLIAQPGIRHIIFVVTCIDAVSDLRQEQDRVVDLIRQRLAENALEAALARFAGDEVLTEKARRILAAPDVSGVSSLLAMKGFVRDDEDLLDESRFPAFKNKLLAYLTAAQSADTVTRTEEAVEEAVQSLWDWYQAERTPFFKREEQLENLISARKKFAETGQPSLEQLFQEMDQVLESRGMVLSRAFCGMRDAAAQLRKPFIARLSALRVASATHENILRALREGKQAAEDAMAGACRSMESWVSEEMDRVEAAVNAQRTNAGLDPAALEKELRSWKTQVRFPEFQWAREPVSSGADLTSEEVMEPVNQAIQASLESFSRQLDSYISAWRMILLRRTAQDRKNPLPVEDLAKELQSCQQRLDALMRGCERDRQQLKAIQQKMDAARKTGY